MPLDVPKGKVHTHIPGGYGNVVEMTSEEKNKPVASAAIRRLGLLLAGLLAMSAAACNGGLPGDANSLNVRFQSDEWSYGGILGQKIGTEHYSIFTTSHRRSLLTVLPGFMENAYRHYLHLTGLSESTKAGRLTVYLMGDRSQWAMMTEQVTGPRHSELYLSIQTGGYCFQGVCVFWDMGHFATFSVASHEGLHQFLHHRLKDGLPSWTEEGLGVMAEGFDMVGSSIRFEPRLNTLRVIDLRRAITGGRWVPLAKLLRADAGDFVTEGSKISAEYYGQLWALLTFIRSDEKYRPGLERMIADAAAGKLRKKLNVHASLGAGRAYVRTIGTPAFKRYITKDLPAFEAEYRAFARELVKLR